MTRYATAVWKGGLRDGHGSISTPSGVLTETQYSFSARFEEGIGTNPEELLAASHAGCFTMALSGQLVAAGLVAERLETTATVTLLKVDGGFAVTQSHLDVKAKISGADAEVFQKAAHAAETGCPISKVLNCKITMTAVLDNA